MVSLTITTIIVAACLFALWRILSCSASVAAMPGVLPGASRRLAGQAPKAVAVRVAHSTAEPRKAEEPRKTAEEQGWSREFQDCLRSGIDQILSGRGASSGEKKPMPRMSYDYSVDRINATLSSVGNMSNIHALQQLSRLMGDSAIGMAEISKVVMTDPVMAGRVLNAANSAYYRMLGKVDSISHALMILGIVHTRSVLLHDGLMKALKLNDAKRKDVLAAFWRHATLTATCAAHLQRLFNGMHSGNAYTAGLLHDVGKYVILAIRGEEGKLDEWLEQGKSGHEGLLQEDELFGINHAVLSANVLEKWGLPASMLKSVDYHHHPEMLEYGIADLTPEEQRQMIILYLADQVATLIDGDPNNPPAVKPIHESYLFLIDRERLWEILSSKKFMEAISMAKAITAPVA